MSKSDQQSILTGLAAGAALGLLLYFVGRRTEKLPEILPTQVKWESA